MASFPNFIESPGGGNSRQSPSPQSQAGQMNGNNVNAANYMAPLPVGHQQDINYLYSQIQELSTILRNNREKVTSIQKTAEEVAGRAANGIAHINGEINGDINDTTAEPSLPAQLLNLKTQLSTAQRSIELLKTEQSENTSLLAQYEYTLGTATEQIRIYCTSNTSNYLSQRQHYNNLLQAEKDEHLQSRLGSDYWQAQAVRMAGMIREAYRLRCEEFGEEVKIVAGLQNEVRVLRNALGLEREREEEETGYHWLKESHLILEEIDES